MYGDQQRGVIHHVPVAPLHTAGAVLLLHHRLIVAGRHQPLPPQPLLRRPPLRLRGTRDGRLHRHVAVQLPQRQRQLAEIQVAPLGHAADEVAIAPLIGRLHLVPQPLLQRKTPAISLIVAPRQLTGPMAGKTAADRSGSHGVPSFPLWFPFHYRTYFLFCKAQKTGGQLPPPSVISLLFLVQGLQHTGIEMLRVLAKPLRQILGHLLRGHHQLQLHQAVHIVAEL